MSVSLSKYIPGQFMILLFSAIFFLAAGCDQQQGEVYVAPTFAGKAYVLAAGDHISVLDFATEQLSMLKLGKKGADLQFVGKRLFVLATDGTIAELDLRKLKPIKWRKIAAKARAMCLGPNNNLLIMADGNLLTFDLDQGVVNKKPLSVEVDYLFADAGAKRIWAVDRRKSTLTALNESTFSQEAELNQVGNSVHHGLMFSGSKEIWLAEGNEYMQGKPYGVGYKKDGPAMLGGINVIDSVTGKQTDFIMVGGNVVDIALAPDKSRVYAAVSQRPDYNEATLSMLDASERRVKAEFRLCDPCHLSRNVEITGGKALVKSMAIDWPDEKDISTP